MIKTSKKEITVFGTPDGREFVSHKEACRHLKKLEKLERIEYFEIIHSPDLTEGRGYRGIIMLAVDSESNQRLYAEMLCHEMFGGPAKWVMGRSPVRSFIIKESSAREFREHKNRHAQVGSSRFQAKRLFLSVSEENLEGMPEPVRIPSCRSESFGVEIEKLEKGE